MPRIYFSIILCLVLNSLVLTQAQAKLVQILHTNDMHGFFEHTVFNTKLGGYAAVKGLIDQQKLQAAKQGIDSLVLDAGDFMEGTIFYMAGEGERTFKMMDLMGYDAVAMGNHDFLMGTDRLEDIIRKNKPSFNFLGANFKVFDSNRYPNITKNVKDSVVFERSGVKIGVVGLTTDEVFYSWSFYGGKISSPGVRAQQVARELKEQGVDVVIALTHLGVSLDRKMIQQSSDIDLVVGGHSHTALFEPLYEKNSEGKPIPIVQAGGHGHYLGRLVIEVDDLQQLKIHEYELMTVNNEVNNHDKSIVEFIKKSRDDLNQSYGQGWLNDIIGETKIPLISSSSIFTPWTAFISTAIKEAVDAEIAFHSPSFAGANLPVGTITREQLFNAYPRVFNFENKFGWSIYKARVKGIFIESVLRLMIKQGLATHFAGVSFDIERTDNFYYDEVEGGSSYLGGLLDTISLVGDYHMTNIRINGKKINKLRDYTVGMPAGLVRGGRGIIGNLSHHIFEKIEKSDKTVWMALEAKFREIKVFDQSYGDRLMGTKYFGHEESHEDIAYSSLASQNLNGLKTQHFSNQTFIQGKFNTSEVENCQR